MSMFSGFCYALNLLNPLALKLSVMGLRELNQDLFPREHRFQQNRK